MSITIPRTSFSKSEALESHANPSRAKGSEEDFESFLIMPANDQQPRPRSVEDRHENETTSESQTSVSATAAEKQAAEDPRPASPFPGKTPEATTQTSLETTASTTDPFAAQITKLGATKGSDEILCQLTEKSSTQNFPATKLGNAHLGNETVRPVTPAVSFAEDIKLADMPLSSSQGFPIGSIPAPQAAAADSINISDLRQFKNIFLTDDGQPFRPIEIELKGAEVQHVDAAAASAGLYPASGIDLTPPRLRVSFADIAEVLRSGKAQTETAWADVSGIQPAEASTDSSGDGTAAFTDAGTSLFQTETSFQAEQAESIGMVRSLQQIENEILQLASAANLRNDGRSLKMRLDSIDLGSIEITLVRHESGSMSAHLVAESEASRQALNENLAQLRSSLENAGLQLKELDISCRSFSTASHQGDRQGREGTHANAGQLHSALSQDASGIPEANGESDIRLLNLRA